MTRTIPLSDGKAIPALGWGNGTAGLASSGTRAIDTGRLVLACGIHHIDTAQSYHTEAETAAAISASGLPRKDVWVTTKISTIENKGSLADSIRASVKGSLDRLGSRPDLLLIHNPYVPPGGPGGVGAAWTALEALVEDGTLAGVSLGVSNFRPQDLEEIFKVAKIKPVVNQLEFHPYLLAQLGPLLALQKKHGIVTQAYGPLTPLLRHPSGGPLKPVVERIAAKHGIDAAQALLLWTVQKGVVAITSSGSEKNIRRIAQIDGLPDLSQEEIDEIDAVGQKVHFRHYKEHMAEDFPVPDLPSE